MIWFTLLWWVLLIASITIGLFFAVCISVGLEEGAAEALVGAFIAALLEVVVIWGMWVIYHSTALA